MAPSALMAKENCDSEKQLVYPISVGLGSDPSKFCKGDCL